MLCEITFPQEFLGRLDEVLWFQKLESDSLAQIARRMLRELQQRLAHMEIAMEFTEDCSPAAGECAQNQAVRRTSHETIFWRRW